MKIINPATEQEITTLKEDGAKDIAGKVSRLRSGQVAWAKKDLDARVRILQQFSDLLERDTDHLAGVLTSEVGKPLKQSRNEINGARARIKWLTDNANKYLSDEVMVKEDKLEERITYEPLGVVANISAWNYPYLVGVNVFVPALLAGNAVLYKPSEYSTLTGLEIQRLLYGAGVPEDVFQTAIGGRETGELILDAKLDGYFFTGSYRTGKHIYEKVSPQMVPCQCELGGKDPLYVADDVADVRAVAAATADGAFYNNGQSCCAVERIYVHEKVYDNYVEEFIKEVKSYKMGSPAQDGVYLGAVARKDQLSVLDDQVKDAVKKGARVLTGGKRVQSEGYFYEPTVLVDVDHSMKVMVDESFGPVIGIMKVKDDAAAIELMKDTEYGLTAAVYSADRSRAEKILREVDAGTGYWNCCDRVSAAVPWSGRKHSGFGSTLSHAGLRAFTKHKALQLRG
jgi:acyl-CoA reductase-like NAD-dependent aldehyde dehydrogenase